MLGLVTRRLQAVKPQQCSCLLEGLSWGTRVVPARVSLWVPWPEALWAIGRVYLRNHLGQLQPGLGNDMVMFQVICQVILHRLWTPGVWCCQTLVLGPHGVRALARVRVLYGEFVRTDMTPVS